MLFLLLVKVTGIALSLRTYRKRVPGYYFGNAGFYLIWFGKII